MKQPYFPYPVQYNHKLAQQYRSPRHPYSHLNNTNGVVREIGQTTRGVAGAGVAMVGIGVLGSLGLGVLGGLK